MWLASSGFRFYLDSMPAGTPICLTYTCASYALAVIHDENMNGKLATNWLGMPTEGYGFSNDAKAMLGPPSFSAASFTYDGQDIELTISLHY